ncbi:hypothetical protein [Coraliomargarita parva]|uniref:hypothetical protein n=1 Tax=Coraliomargarita parva TaxID=3014050 RepID=UPI0022B43BBF|nr:hypothetical protein [Coraliomargarita parva]
MSDNLQLYDSSIDSGRITELKVLQRPDSSGRSVEITTLDKNGKEKILKLYAPDDIDSIGEIFSASRFWIEKERGTQKEFGTICLGFTAESYIEVWFDSFEELKSQPADSDNVG